jgi:hypothetical protein
MPTNAETKWFVNVVSHPGVIVDPYSVEDIVAIMKDPASSGTTTKP